MPLVIFICFVVIFTSKRMYTLNDNRLQIYNQDQRMERRNTGIKKTDLSDSY